MVQDLIQRIEQLKARISDSRHIVALTGAGVSAESGVPTFRGKKWVMEGLSSRRYGYS